MLKPVFVLLAVGFTLSLNAALAQTGKPPKPEDASQARAGQVLKENMYQCRDLIGQALQDCTSEVIETEEDKKECRSLNVDAQQKCFTQLLVKRGVMNTAIGAAAPQEPKIGHVSQQAGEPYR